MAEKADLGKIAQAVNQAKTPHRSEAAPGLAVVLFADLDKDSAKAAVAALGKIKGVDGKGSQADPKKGELSVKIAGGEKVTVTNIVAALKNAGIETSTTKAKN